MSEEGVISATYVYDFERGNFDNEVASFVEPDIQEETPKRAKNGNKK